MVAPLPKVSVLVPCFNDGRFLGEALASIAAQSFGDFEVVVSDDASSDDSAAIAEAWAARDPRFRLLRNAENLGMTENWSRALAAARGELVAKLDGDDAWRPDTLKRLLEALDSARGVLAAFCRAEVGDESLGALLAWPGDSALARAGIDPLMRRLDRGGRFWLLSLGDAQLWHSNAFLLRRADLEQLGGFDERWSCAADTALLLRVLAEDRPTAHVPYAGVLYRRRAGSVSARFEERGWKALEAELVRLDALARDGRRFAPLPRTARQAWWQTWRNFRGLRRDEALWSGMPERLRRKLKGAAARVVPPPLPIRAEGWLRLQGWRARAAIVPRAAKGSG
ncbi:MAG TPA: glycosyltransferase [Planctomycetota bacterium]|nr:glycosyltransferase [Planctomycetota bacterium]